jgi:hypothetical protein
MKTNELTQKLCEATLGNSEHLSGSKPKNYPAVEDNEQLITCVNSPTIIKVRDMQFHSIYEYPCT